MIHRLLVWLGLRKPEPPIGIVWPKDIRWVPSPAPFTYDEGTSRYGAIVPGDDRSDAEMEQWVRDWAAERHVDIVEGTLFIKRRPDGMIRVAFAGRARQADEGVPRAGMDGAPT